ncbi:MAG: M23 family peptidase, partial [Flavobacteriaceae bacterium]
MQRFFGAILALISLVSCKEDKKEQLQEIAQEIVEPPVIKHFGFNLEEFKVVQDTIKKGETFGELMLKNKVDYPKIIHIAEQYKDTFDIRRIDRKPYVLLKSKDTSETAEVFIYQNDKINYTVFDFRDSTANAYKGRRKVKLIEREVGGIINSSLSQTLDSLGV